MTTNQELSGPLHLGYFFNWALLGILNVQVYFYYVTFSRDSIFLQCLVYGILIFEWVQTGLITQGAFEIFVYHYGDPEALGKIYNGWFALLIMCALVSMVVQCFFAWRIYMLSKVQILMGGIVLLSLLQGIGGIMVGLKIRTLSSLAVGDIFSDAALGTAIYIWLVGSAVVDVMIAVTMTMVMLRRKTGIRRTDKMINRLIRLVLETGTLTATFAIVGLSLIIAFPMELYIEPVLHILGKLYANTFITNLLNRAFLNGKYHQTGSDTSNEISLAFPPVSGDIEFARDNTGTNSRELSGDRSIQLNRVQKDDESST